MNKLSAAPCLICDVSQLLPANPSHPRIVTFVVVTDLT